jgi:hypothetical protein
MNESNETLRRKREEYQRTIREAREVIRAAELLISDIDRQLRGRQETTGRLELRESER